MISLGNGLGRGGEGVEKGILSGGSKVVIMSNFPTPFSKVDGLHFLQALLVDKIKYSFPFCPLIIEALIAQKF